MRAVEPAYLPLQPLGLASSLGAPDRVSSTLSASPYALPSSCSVSSLRQSFHPFPVRSAVQRRLSPGSLGGEEGGMEKPEAFLGNFVVRPMKRGDVDEVKRLQDDCLPTSCPPVFYTSLLTSPTSLCLLAYSPSSPSSILGCISASLASYSSLHSEPTPPSIYIFTLAVAPSARQQGLAYHLIRAVVKALLPKSLLSWLPQKARVKLHVEATNVAARRLYRKLGLEEKARARGFYRRLQGGGSGEAIEMEGVLTV